MAVEIKQNADQLNLSVTCNDTKSEVEISRTFDELNEVLDIISSHLNTKGIYFFGITIHSKTPLLSGIFRKLRGNASPEDGTNPNFWIKALKMKAMRPRIKEYISNIENLLDEANRAERSTFSLWESDEVQLGESVVTLLALQDKEFVPCYTSLLQHWDMGHEVNQKDAIELIVKKYGICEEIGDLLYHRAFDVEAQWHVDQIEELIPFLGKQDKGFYESEIFEKIVSGFYLGIHSENLKEFNSYKEEVEEFNADVEIFNNTADANKPDEKPFPPRTPRFDEDFDLFEDCEDNALAAAAERVFAKCKTNHPTPDLNSVKVATVA